VGRKLAHVHPDLRDQGLSRSAVDARDGVEKFDLLRERGDHPLDLDAKIIDRIIEVVDVGHYLAHHEGMMRGEASLQSIPERGQLGAKTARANSAKTSGSVVPPTSASSIALPEAPSTRVATEESFIPASWSTFSRRWTSLVGSSILKPCGSG
jgi:hypothetical protein